MNDALMLFSIGPVQSFIAEARRTHDLWAGSRILVDITRTTLQEIMAAFSAVGVKLLFPTEVDQKSIPNIFALMVPYDQADEIAKVAKAKAQDEFANFAEEALVRLRDRLNGFAGMAAPDLNFENIWNRQLAQHLEFNWVACRYPKPLANGETPDHGEWYDFARRALETRKRTRDFLPSEEPGMKDSFSGQRAALCLRDKNAQEFWQAVHENLSKRKVGTMLQPNGRERLDAIGLAKRFFRWKGDEDIFPSISSVAAASFLREVKKNETAKALLVSYGQLLEQAESAGLNFKVQFDKALVSPNLPEGWQYDGEWFYEERLYEDYNARELGRQRLTDEQIKILRRLQGSLAHLCRVTKSRPNPYYAILMLDGDKMGEHISRCRHADEHREVSRRLARFATSAEAASGARSPDEFSFQKIVEYDHCGCVIYAGGDDVLALLPLDEALAAANAIQRAYTNGMKGLQADFDFTCSAGIVFAHHRSPLDAALSAARQAEKEAKNKQRYNRSAVCVTALKRSGAPATAGAKWNYGDLNTISIIEKLVALFKAELSSKFVFDVAETAHAFVDLSQPAHEAELRRLLKRHGLQKEKAKEIAIELTHLAAQMEKAAKDVAAEEGIAPLKELRGPVALADWLILARFIAQGGNT